jgi:protein-S-isoprenylcysteine O-methyltransferase Ste14
MKRRIKINGFIIFIAVLLTAFFPAIFFRKANNDFFDEIIEILGIAFILLGQILRASARGFKSEYSQNGNALIQDGPYNLVRHPMYLGILLIGLGIVAMLFKWWAICIFLLFFIGRYLLLIFKEEKKLQALFPKDYPVYQQRVPRILPSIAMLLQHDVSEYLPLKLSWLKKEIGSIIAVLSITLFVESWEDIKREGPWVYLHEVVMIIFTVTLFIGLVIYLNKRTANFKKNVSNKNAIN